VVVQAAAVVVQAAVAVVAHLVAATDIKPFRIAY